MNAIKILHDGGSFLAVSKPAGLSTQAPHGAESLESRLREQIRDRSNYAAFPHRLDRPVSGVILVALTKRAARLLSDQFAARKVRKTYLAWVVGNATDATSTWKDWLRKIPDQPRGEVCSESADGAKLAQTQVQTVGFDPATNRTLLKLCPITGRMHQLRIQAAQRGHVIVGDHQYGAEFPATVPSKPADSIEEPAKRIWLHADRITFHDPKNGRETTVECPDDDFRFAV
ncbi:RluA family pseudouridine synthase [Planctomycetes bacterium K23_9]|uniref:Ribosomal large subunit pseudouridine synthase A n=1 Tax=Stieleria marina TaxID=1930275 RepID=A0A517NQD7_9BACT|nr:Ribosomal large subunit pseudouridine synthase A [Planctomycetes bacterium K23_9]